MQYPNLVKRPSRTAFGKLMVNALQTHGRVIHSSRADGLYVKAYQPSFLHRLELEYYPVHSMLGPLLPRLMVNRSSCGIPERLFREWQLPYHKQPFQKDVSLEITFLPEEAELISKWTTNLIDTLEDGENRDWSRGFPFDVHKTTPTNIWTKAANEFANECVRANGSLNPRKTS